MHILFKLENILPKNINRVLWSHVCLKNVLLLFGHIALKCRRNTEDSMTSRNMTPFCKGWMNVEGKKCENTFDNKAQLRGNVFVCWLECINAS